MHYAESMPFKLIIKADAYEDLAEAFEYYYCQSPGLGNRFWIELEKNFDKLENHPTHYGYSYELPGMIFRDVLMEKFPYKIFYEILGSEIIVYGIIHAHRDPDFIKRRLT